ncbi:MAG: glycoside hydrolase family 38 C-terminal domain-containing protein [Phycisphaerales bacterium]
MPLTARLIGVASFTTLLAQAAYAAFPDPDRCIAFVTTNLAKGRGNWYTYQRFSDQRVKIADGDVLTYRIYLDPRNPEPKGSVDADFEDGGKPLRDLHIKDDAGADSHGDGDLSAAKGKWVTRRIPLSAAKGRTIVTWSLTEEGDKDGQYAFFVDDIAVIHADGKRTEIYRDGPVPSRTPGGHNGYTNQPACVAIDSSLIADGKDVAQTVALAQELGKRTKALDDLRREAKLAQQFAERDSDPHMKGHAEEAAAAIARADRANATPDEIDAALNAARAALTHAHPAMEKFTGHLVGHAHIDLQWLWEWQEGICFTHDTFAQAVRFMDEYKGFTFSQSSSCLYQAMEESYPALFADIQKKVKAGQWEPVGGRVCEGDTNMISEESSARQFLYGQRYFREKLGTTTTVGWEPDTFGHTFQMPQLLKLAGCDSYYFCRGGKNKPLFWWEGLDGTRVLAFDEPASGSWYNSDLSYQQFQEMLDFDKNTGSKDSLWVYGVGNHGGGPTREHITWALDQMKSTTAPTVRFSTASEFFKKLRTYDLTKIPVVHEELNGVFSGCYTTHSDIKQLNRRAEAATTSAEAVAAVASLNGFKYPTDQFRRSWEEICFNHHHDTLPGTGTHPTYDRTRTQLNRVIADDRDITTRAMEALTIRVKPKSGGVNVLVFNPTGAPRTEWVETCLVRSGWDNTDIPKPDHCVAEAPDGKRSPATLIDANTDRIRFRADNIPAYGYRVFHLASGDPQRQPLTIRDDGATIETDKLIVEFDREGGRGGIKRLFDKSANREACKTEGTLGRLEAHWEANNPMDAWTLGHIQKVDQLKPAEVTFTHGVDCADATFTYILPAWNKESRDSRITQRFRVMADTGRVECDVDCQWNAVGSPHSPNAMLKVAFDTATQEPAATYHVPFGALQRPTDGHEVPALQWADVSETLNNAKGGGGVTVLNDAKHGFACKGSTLTMSLIRATYRPDPLPNAGDHHWRYAILPHSGDWHATSPCAAGRGLQPAPPRRNRSLRRLRLAATRVELLQGAVTLHHGNGPQEVRRRQRPDPPRLRTHRRSHNRLVRHTHRGHRHRGQPHRRRGPRGNAAQPLEPDQFPSVRDQNHQAPTSYPIQLSTSPTDPPISHRNRPAKSASCP